MSDKLARDLASVTEELTSAPIVELNEVEIAAVSGGYYASKEK